MDINTYSNSTHTTHLAQGHREGGEDHRGWGTMLTATELLCDTVTDGVRSPVRTWMSGLIWLPVPQEAASPTTTLTPCRIDTPHYTQQKPQQLQPRRQRHSNTNTNNGRTPTPTQQQQRAAQDSPGQPRKDAWGTAGPG